MGEIEILRIPPILKILILTETARGVPTAFAILWIPAFAGMRGRGFRGSFWLFT